MFAPDPLCLCQRLSLLPLIDSSLPFHAHIPALQCAPEITDFITPTILGLRFVHGLWRRALLQPRHGVPHPQKKVPCHLTIIIKKDTLVFDVKNFAKGNERKMKEILEKRPIIDAVKDYKTSSEKELDSRIDRNKK
ncbi:hypothetical protein [Flavobacterium acetivorans]|uniref:hypothetical protein n=1 Tax=Flavobacterium acetivorans TaxID=2893883 RepID=UPI001E5E2095|nr:hypothetical protein [Flavobacterium sp. F-29]UFH34658.1 hypothetical protein LNP19_11230 [Flavobacterium sp. F-29]